MKALLSWIFLASAALLTGCAHSIDVTPIAGLDAKEGAATRTRIPAKAAYYISPELKDLEVTTAGGGGDNVRYYPYQAIDAGFFQMLANVFESAVKLDSKPTSDDFASKGITYLIEPTIVTSSGSTGFFTWPPTNFTVDLTSQVRSRNGAIVAMPRVVGVGVAYTSERLNDHGIAGRRAIADALIKMQDALFEINQNKAADLPVSTPQTSTTSDVGPIADRLNRLKLLLDQGVITKQEYENRRKSILGEL